MSTKSKSEVGAIEGALPGGLVAADCAGAIERLASYQMYAEALAVAESVGTRQMQAHAGHLLASLGGELSYRGPHALMSDRSVVQSLAWAQKLIEWGGDPFAESGIKGSVGFQKSFFENIIAGGFWAYASSLADSVPQGASKVAAVFDSMAQQRPSPWGGAPSASTKVHQLLAKAGATALALGFKAGMNPNEVVQGSPWIFLCTDASSLDVFVAAGANAQAKDENGRALSESFADRPSGKGRQELLAAARLAQSAGATVDKESAAREAFALAKAGSGAREVAKAAKAAGLEIEKMRSPSGLSMLGVALEAGNWGLAHHLLVMGVDPKELSPEGFPVGVLILSGEAVSSASKSFSKSDKSRACMDLVLGGLDFSWRDPDGDPILEAFCKKRALANAGSGLVPKLSYQAARQWTEHEPMNVQCPLWSRMDNLGQSSWLVYHCARTRSLEPWSHGEKMLMERLMAGGLTQRYGKASWDSDNYLIQFFKNEGFGDKGKANMERFCSESQWAAAFDSAWTFARGQRHQFAEVSARLASAVDYWLGLSAKQGVDAFNMDALSKSLLRGWKAVEASSSAEAAELCEKVATMVCLRAPSHAGGLFLDMLARQGHYEIRAAERIWRQCDEAKINLALPNTHPLLSEPDLVRPELANHPLWVLIEERLMERASAPARRARL